MLSESIRILKPGGRLTIADVGASAAWRLPVINSLMRLATFLYFLHREGSARARAEAGALSHVLTAQEWESKLAELGFDRVSITRLPTKRFWTPPPLVIQAIKPVEED
jgi:ubiquinone/menaquinone biosynthesis C-methylase UbiE